jgi:hypothetical protein
MFSSLAKVVLSFQEVKEVESFSILAERKLYFVNSISGSKSKVVIRIGYPYWVVENEEAACPAYIDGEEYFLKDCRLQDIRGIDLFQALQQAISLLNHLFRNLPEKYIVYHEDGAIYEVGKIKFEVNL